MEEFYYISHLISKGLMIFLLHSMAFLLPSHYFKFVCGNTNYQSIIGCQFGCHSDPTDDYTITNNNIVFSTAPVSGIRSQRFLEHLISSKSILNMHQSLVSLLMPPMLVLLLMLPLLGFQHGASTAGISTVAENLTNCQILLLDQLLQICRYWF